MRVLLVDGASTFGEPSQHVLNIATGLRDRNHLITVACSGTKLARAVRSGGMEAIQCSFIDVRKAISAYQPDVVHSHGMVAGIIANTAAWMIPGPTLVHTIHRAFEDPTVLPPQAARLVGRMLSWRTELMITLTGESKRRLLKWSIPEKKTTCVYAGVNTCTPEQDARRKARKSLFIPTGCNVVGSVIRSLDEPAQENLMQSIRLVCNQNDNVLFVLIGDSGVVSKGKQLAQAMAVSHRVMFADDSRDPRDLFPAFDVYLMPGGKGIHPLSMTQAMATGLPVIAADMPGVSEIVVDGVTGHIVSCNDPVTLASGIIRTLHSAESSEMTDAAVDRAMTMFDVDRMIHIIERLYTERMELRSSNIAPAATH